MIKYTVYNYVGGATSIITAFYGQGVGRAGGVEEPAQLTLTCSAAYKCREGRRAICILVKMFLGPKAGAHLPVLSTFMRFSA